MSDKEEKPQRWYNPKDILKEPIYRAGLMVNSSLCNEKVEFFTKNGDRTINWYMCGLTVYDSAHLEHIRTYLTFDIIRRILNNYFHYDVNLCMNIKDIDDKIIQRSNEQKKIILNLTDIRKIAFSRHVSFECYVSKLYYKSQ